MDPSGKSTGPPVSAARLAELTGVPLPPQPFVGRDGFLKELSVLLRGEGVQVVSLSGPAGSGKTALVAALVRRPGMQRHFFDGVLWARLGLQGDALAELAAWANALGKDVSGIPALVDRAKAVKNQIGGRRLLLVIEDAWDLDTARALQCGGPGCVHLLTTHNPDLARAFAGEHQSRSLPPLSIEAANQMVCEIAPEACHPDPATAMALAGLCHGLPLAIELLGGYLAAPEDGFAQEEGSSDQRIKQAADQILSRSDGDSILTEVLRLSLDSLPVPARRAFSDLGAFSPDPERFSREAATMVTGAPAEILDLLAARRLIQTDRDQLAMHQVLADVACQDTSPAAAARHSDYYLQLAQRNRKDLCGIAQVYGQIRWAWSAEQDGERLLDWIEALSTYQEKSGQWTDYVDWAERGLRVAGERGLLHVQGVLYNNLAKVYSDLGQRERALSYYQSALPILEESGNQEELAAALSNMGTAFASLGKTERALMYYQRALPVLEGVGNLRALVTTLNNLGKLYTDQGEKERALVYYRRALPALAELEDYRLESTIRFNLALLYRSQDRLPEAIAELRQVVALESLIDHPDLESDSALLAQVERDQASPKLLRWFRKLF